MKPISEVGKYGGTQRGPAYGPKIGQLDTHGLRRQQLLTWKLDLKTLSLKHYRIDADHSNSYTEWVHQGRPMYPSGGQYAAIKARDGLELLEPPQTVTA